MPKIILKNGSEFVVEQDILDDILPKKSDEMIQLGNNFFKKSSIEMILEDEDLEFSKTITPDKNISAFATAGTRLSAFIVDFIFYIIYSILIFMVIGFSAGFTGNQVLIDIIDTDIYDGLVFPLIYISYFFFSFLFYKNTIGGKLTKIKIVNMKGEVPSSWRLAFRSVFIGFPLGFGVISIFFDNKNRAVHDKTFSTIVVYENSDYIKAIQNSKEDQPMKSFQLS